METRRTFYVEYFVSGTKSHEENVDNALDGVNDAITWCKCGHYGYTAIVRRNNGYGGKIVAQVDKKTAINHAEYYRNVAKQY